MNTSQLLKRVISNPKVMLGKPVIRGTRVLVSTILGALAGLLAQWADTRIRARRA